MPFGTGEIGDWVCHVIDPVFWALNLDAPATVQAEVDGFDVGISHESDVVPEAVGDEW